MGRRDDLHTVLQAISRIWRPGATIAAGKARTETVIQAQFWQQATVGAAARSRRPDRLR